MDKLRVFDKILAALICASMVVTLILGYQVATLSGQVSILLEANGGTNGTVQDILDQATGDGATGQQLITGEDAEDILNSLMSLTYKVRTSNSYIPVVFGENEEVVIYNTKGENIYQDVDGNTTVFMDNGQGVYFSDYITYGTDCDLIQSMWIAAMTAVDGSGNLYEIPMEDSDGNAVENAHYYLVEIEGYDNINKMYSYIDNIYAGEMVDQIKQSVAEGEFSDGIDTSNASLRYAYIVDDEDGLVSGACYLFFGDTGRWDNAAINWYFDGIVTVGDWELGDEWYDFDYEDESEEAANALADMLVDLHSRVTTMLNEYEEMYNGSSESDDTSDTSSDNSANSETTDDDDTTAVGELDEGDLEELEDDVVNITPVA